MYINYKILLASNLVLGVASVGRAQTATHPLADMADVVTSATPAPVAPEVLTYADEMPAFPGGEAAFHQYLTQKINYPAGASQQNLSGTVYVRFVVDEQGRIRDAEVAKGCGHGFDKEALRLVRLMPWWTPGRVAGHPVRVMKTLPIIFRLSR